MRNLKRTLSLVLAMALVVGMMMVGASAASSDFVDGDEITYTEAAEIMTALGVFEGTDKGAFDPAGTLTREQAAAIICRMLLGDDAENVNTNSVVFSDVAADRWSAGYIAYCAQQGILAGTGNGTFDPEGELTGLAFAKMLLVALGYDPAIEQYVGDDWAVNVAADAVDAGIAISGVVMANAVSREQAAQMAYQTLEANMVSYASKGTTVIGSDGMQVIVGASAAEPVDNYITNDYDSSKDGIQQFCERYFSDLKKTDGEDDFNRPAAQWKLKNDVIGTYAEEADGTYTTSVSVDDIYDLLGRTVGDKGALTVITNGDSKDITGADRDKYIKNGDDDTKIGGKGVLTQVYVVDDTDKDDVDDVIISMINTYVAQVDGDYDEENEELVLDDLGLDLPADSTTLSSEDFENLAAFSDGDYVLVTVNSTDSKIKTIQSAETVTGTVTSYTTGKNVTVDGKRYEYSQGYSSTYSLNNDYDLVLDTYGYVIYADGVEASDDYVFITDVAQVGGVNKSWEAKAYFTDGTTAVIEVSKVEDNKLGWTDDNRPENKWYTYDEKNDGTYELENTTATTGTVEKTATKITETGSARVYYTDNASVSANNDTVFVVRRGDNVNVYTGIKSVPDINAKTVDGNVVDVTVSAIMDGTYADYVFIGASEISVSGSVAGDRIYILDTDYESSRDDNDNDYYVFDAIVNGEIGTAQLNSYTGIVKGLYEIKYDADGYVDITADDRITDANDENLRATGVNATVTYAGGVLSFGSLDLVLADDCTIFLNDDGTGKTTTASRLARDYGKTNFEGAVSWVVDDNVVTEVYVDAKATADKTLASTTAGQPESAEALIESMKGTSDFEDWNSVPYLVSLGLTQRVEDDTIYLSGTVTAINADTELTEDQLAGLNQFWTNSNITSYDDLVTKGLIDADDEIAFLVVTENGNNHFTVVEKNGDGALFFTGNGAGDTVKEWPNANFKLDISGLSF